MLKVVGFLQVEAKIDHRKERLQLYVVDSNRHALLGREWIRELKLDLNTFLMSDVSALNLTTDTSNPKLHSLIRKYSTVFGNSAGKITGISAAINLKTDARPIFIRAR